MSRKTIINEWGDEELTIPARQKILKTKKDKKAKIMNEFAWSKKSNAKRWR